MDSFPLSEKFLWLGEPKNMYIFRYLFLFSCCLSLAYCNLIQKTVLNSKEQTAKNKFKNIYLKYFKTLNISFTSSFPFFRRRRRRKNKCLKNNKNVPTKYIYWTKSVIIVLFNGHWKPQSWYIDNLRTTSVHDKRKIM